ncbi:MAG: hypothetical protein M5U26_23760 [Planctomycetota bacterium]|nr:hypothetical protein [Planctomycetota bacterium]
MSSRIETFDAPCRAVTRGPAHHFFGYYDKCPWDATGRFMLALEVSFIDRMPRAEDAVTVGLVDLLNGGSFTPLDETTAWCWQQGTMLQWLPDGRILYNAREGGRFVARIRDVGRGTARTLPRAIYAVSPDGRHGLSLNFARLNRTRPGYGYEGVPDATAGDPAPAGDGIWLVDLESGRERLLFSHAQSLQVRPRADFAGAEHWFNHLTFAPGGRRYVGLHRWWKPEGLEIGGKRFRHVTRLFTQDRDGGEVHLLNDDEMTSHYAWRDAEHLLAWARRHGRGDHYYVFRDGSAEAEILGADVLTADGHCTYSPDGKWILTDTYPDRNDRKRTLILYRLRDGVRFDIGRFFAPPDLDGEKRCDLHPRFSRDGTEICIDSAHEGARQMYVVDVRELVGREG